MLRMRQTCQELVLHILMGRIVLFDYEKYKFEFRVFLRAQCPSCFLGYVHDAYSFLLFIVCLPPINMVHIEKIFSESVLAETLPKPTLVKLLRAK